MRFVLHPHGSSSPLLLGLLGLGGAGLLLFASATRTARPPPASLGGAAHDGGEHALPLASRPAQREPLRASAALPPALELEREQGAEAAPEARAPGARKEREFLQAFLALAHDRPGELETRAAALLHGEGPAAEKIALLRALRASGSSESVRWHEHAVCTQPDVSGPHGGGVATHAVADHALGELERDARLDPLARSALARISFEREDLALALRRRAATGFARTCDEQELQRLERELVRASDELLVSGVLVALAEREPSAGSTRILAAYGRSHAEHEPPREP